MPTLRSLRSSLVLFSMMCASATVACGHGGKGKKTEAFRWLDKPSSAKTNGRIWLFSQLGVRFELPETLYVYRSCGEASHSPEGENKWIPIITCRSVAGNDEDEYAEGSASEGIALTFYVTEKSRPIDERSIAWFENQYKQAGLQIDTISYNDNFQKKAGIYAKLHVVDSSTGTPTREIVQFMFPKQDIVFIARMEYPYGDTRSVQADWKYLLWNFDSDFAGDENLPPAPKEEAEPEAEPEKSDDVL